MKKTMILFVAILGALSAAAQAEIQDLAVQLPQPLTWREPLIATYSGHANCFVQTGAVTNTFENGAFVISVALEQICILDPPSVQPFSGQADLGVQQPGHYTVRFKDGEQTLFTGPLTVYQEADVRIDLADEYPTSGHPLHFTVTGFSTGCLSPPAPVVEGNVITAFFPVDCPILPIGSGIFTFDYTTPALAAGDYEIRVFVEELGLKKRQVHVFDAAGCVPSAAVLCLGDDRFRLQVAWEDFEGHTGVGKAVPLPGRPDTGLFWFFDPGNIELTVKVLNGCGLNGRYWVFVASGSTVEYTLTVTDTSTDTTWTEHHESGVIPALVADTSAFATCQ